MENGIIKNVGNVTNVQTWVNTFKSPLVFFGVGKGIMSTGDGQIATWKGYDIGKSNNNSAITYHGITFFDTNSTGKLSFLKNLIGLHMTKVSGTNNLQRFGNGNDMTKSINNFISPPKYFITDSYN